MWGGRATQEQLPGARGTAAQSEAERLTNVVPARPRFDLYAAIEMLDNFFPWLNPAKSNVVSDVGELFRWSMTDRVLIVATCGDLMRER